MAHWQQIIPFCAFPPEIRAHYLHHEQREFDGEEISQKES
jgi:hypothetical protein